MVHAWGWKEGVWVRCTSFRNWRWWRDVTWLLCLLAVCPLAPALPTWAVMCKQQLTISLLMLKQPLWCQIVVFFLWMTSIPLLEADQHKEGVCSFAIFGNFEVNKNCHVWQFFDSIITDENAKYCQKWQKKWLKFPIELEIILFIAIFGNNMQLFIAIFGNFCHKASSCHLWQLWGQ